MSRHHTTLRNAAGPVVDRAVMDALDARRMLAFSSLNAGGTLSVNGTSGNNVISVELSGAFILAKRDGVTEKWSTSKVKRVWANGYSGNDNIAIKTGLPAMLLGDSGNDTLIGNNKADSFYGGSGNDQLFGNDGNDTFFNGSDGADRYDGGAGDDTFAEGAAADQVSDGADTFIGGAGNDSISYAQRQQSLMVSLDNVANDGGPGENDDVRSDVENITGGEEPDFLVGSSAANVIDAGVVFFDLDTIFGGAGNDTLSGGILDGGAGNDRMEGGTYEYSSRTKPLSFTFDTNIDAYRGGEAGETDTLFFSLFYNNELVLGSGNDKVTNARGFIIRGGAGNDTLSGTVDDELGFGSTLYGDAGNDLLTTTSNALIEGGLGNDTMSTGDAADSTLSFAYAKTPVKISFDGNNTNDGPVGEKDVIKTNTFAAVIGGTGDDVFIGDNNPNSFEGGGGNDSLVGKGGDDTLVGDIGRDTLNGGLGDDVFEGGQDTDADTVDYSDRTEDLTINICTDSENNGAAGENDSFQGDIEVVLGGSGDDLIIGNLLNNTLRGGSGNDTIRGESGNDSVLGDAGNDQLFGGIGNDTLRGGSGTDFLTGDAGTDQLFGEADNDVLFAQDNTKDLVDGGAGSGDVASYDKSPVLDQLIGIETKL